MGAIASPNYTLWAARYPELSSSVSTQLYAAYWGEATIFHSNNGNGPVADINQQLALLNMVVSHIATRYANINGVAPSPTQPPGRISSATEGSVSASFDFTVPPGSAQWWNQTKYGSDYWLAMAPYRTMHYRPAYGRRRLPW